MQYLLRVIQPGQAPHTYEIEATSTVEAVTKAEQQGYAVLQVLERSSFSGGSGFLSQSSNFPLVLFCQEFRVLFEAGLSVTDVLQTLIDKETNHFHQQVLDDLMRAVQEGKTLSQAMMLNSQVFPSLFVATMSAAETTGDIPEALMRYGHYLESIDGLKKKIVSATLYPAIVTGFGILVFVFLMVFVIPKFSKIYESQVKTVSVSTEVLLSLGKFSQQYGVWLLAVLAIAVVGLIGLFNHPLVRVKVTDILWRLPYLGQHIKIFYLARFYRTFSMLLKSGVPVLSGLGMVDSLLGARLKENVLYAKQLIAEGKSFSSALLAANLTTPVAIRLFNVGEKTGTLDQMMERAANFHEDQMTRWIDRFSKVFEPMLMAAIGLMIGGIVLMMYLPIFELASGIE